MNIAGLDKAEVLAALVNGGSVQGLGGIDSRAGKWFTVEKARELLDSGETYFDYVHGRVVKIDLSGDDVNTRLYDRDNGPGAALNALADLIKSREPKDGV